MKIHINSSVSAWKSKCSSSARQLFSSAHLGKFQLKLITTILRLTFIKIDHCVHSANANKHVHMQVKRFVSRIQNNEVYHANATTYIRLYLNPTYKFWKFQVQNSCSKCFIGLSLFKKRTHLNYQIYQSFLWLELLQIKFTIVFFVVRKKYT